MGVNVPPLKPQGYHRIVIGLTGPLSPADAKNLKRDLDRVLDRYRQRVARLTPAPRKKARQSGGKRTPR